MKIGTFLLFLLFCVHTNVDAQNIKGTVRNEKGEKVKYTNIVIKHDRNSAQIENFAISSTGDFDIALKTKFNKVSLTFTAVNYEIQIIDVDLKVNEENAFLNVTLLRKKIHDIEEVILKKNNQPVEVKKDTVVYNVAAFKSDSDRKLNDVIKKLPGITVNEKSGEIKYHGKSIETIKIEGDDLFGNNYTIGSKNINVDIVEKIEAIENYSSNEMLAGIENSDKVALNLKLKKGKVDLSGNVEWASGFDADRKQIQNINSTALQVSSKFKSFLNLSYNNIGGNSSPVDYFSNSASIDQMKNSQYYARKIITDNSFETNVDDWRSNINNQLFTSFNTVFKLLKDNSTRLNVFYLKDGISQNINENTVVENSLLLSNNYSFTKDPENFNLNLYSKQKVSKKSIVEFSVIKSKEKIAQQNNIAQNNTDYFNTEILSDNIFFKNNITYTNKVASNKALQLITNFSINDSPQTFLLDPPVCYNELSISKQESRFRKRILDFSLLYHVSKTRYKYLASFGSLSETNKYNSENQNNDLSNDFKHRKNSYYFYSNFNFRLNSLAVSPSINVLLLNQSLTGKNITENNFIIEPNLNLRYRLSANSLVTGIIGYSQKPFTEERLFENPVLINHRTVIQNEISLKLQRTFDSKFTYAFSNDFTQTKFRFNLIYSDQTGSFFSNISITPNITSTIFYYQPNKRITRSADIYFDKYFTFLDSVIKLNSSYSSLSSQNIVNNSEVRDILNNSLVNEFVYRTVFSLPVNFENKITHHLSTISVDNVRNNSLNSINNSFKIFSKFGSKISLNASFDYFRPNLKDETAFKFVDFSLTYKYSKSSEVAFISRNIFNQSSLTVTDVTDYSVSSIQTNILPRQLMLFVSYSF